LPVNEAKRVESKSMKVDEPNRVDEELKLLIDILMIGEDNWSNTSREHLFAKIQKTRRLAHSR